METCIKFCADSVGTFELAYMPVNLVVPILKINCVPSLFYIGTEGSSVGRITLFLQHMFGFYSGKAVLFKFLGLVCICQWPNAVTQFKLY